MALKKQRIPYEVLVRFDEKGQYKGAHVGYISQVIENGQVLATNTELVEVNDENFPLLDVMNEVQASAIRRVEVLDTELNNLNAEYDKAVKDIEGLRTELSRSETDLNVAKDEIKQLRLEIEGLNSQATEVAEIYNKAISEKAIENEDLKKELAESQLKLVKAHKLNQELINNIKVDESNKTEEVER